MVLQSIPSRRPFRLFSIHPGPGNDRRPTTALKTNAAQASHPDRIGFAIRSVTLVHARGMGEFISTRSEKRCVDALGRSPLAKQTSQVDLQHHGGRRPVLPCVEDSVRRPQRPGNQLRAEARSWRIPPNDSPSRIAGHRRLCRNALAGHTERLA